jgi:hypothetical protein
LTFLTDKFQVSENEDYNLCSSVSYQVYFQKPKSILCITNMECFANENENEKLGFMCTVFQVKNQLTSMHSD